jgi:hypothetical protein
MRPCTPSDRPGKNLVLYSFSVISYPAVFLAFTHFSGHPQAICQKGLTQQHRLARA